MEGLEARVKALEDGVQDAVDKAAEKLLDQLRPTHTETLNVTVTQAVEKALENHLKGQTEKAKQPHGATEPDPEDPRSSGRGKCYVLPPVGVTSLVLTIEFYSC